MKNLWISIKITLAMCVLLTVGYVLILEVNEPSIPSMSFGFIDYVLEHPEVLRQEE